jgi:hypothetical protein
MVIKWKYLSVGAVLVAGVLAFLRVIANEILAVEKRLQLIVAEQDARERQSRPIENAA